MPVFVVHGTIRGDPVAVAGRKGIAAGAAAAARATIGRGAGVGGVIGAAGATVATSGGAAALHIALLAFPSFEQSYWRAAGAAVLAGATAAFGFIAAAGAAAGVVEAARQATLLALPGLVQSYMRAAAVAGRNIASANMAGTITVDVRMFFPTLMQTRAAGMQPSDADRATSIKRP